MNLNEILKMFDIDTSVESYGNGHINDTYLCSSEYILQRINTNVFLNPERVMDNIYKVTEHIGKKIALRGGDVSRETMTVIPAKDGKLYYKYDDNNWFRMYNFIKDSAVYDIVDDPVKLYYAGRAFGTFQRDLNDFPANELYETIKDFHNTPERVNRLEEAARDNKAGRLDEVKAELDFCREYARYAGMILDAIDKKEIPVRVTHNDTKINNVLFDKDSGEEVCVIDLDTVMPGSVLYDFGDALRAGATSGAEDETDLDKIYFDLEKFEQFTKGFMEKTADCLTGKEIELLPVSALILTYECGTRFLTDYLNGDTYFKIHREKHNLDRARNQFKLVMDIESKLDEMADIVKKYAVGKQTM